MNYKCHNCGHGTSLSKFVEFIDPELHKQYIMERWKDGGNQRKTSDEPTFDFKPVVFRKIDSNYVTKISDLEENHHARLYLENRKLPIEDLYFTEDFKCFVDDMIDRSFPFKIAIFSLCVNQKVSIFSPAFSVMRFSISRTMLLIVGPNTPEVSIATG